MTCNYSTQAYYAIVTTCAYCMHSQITTFCSWQRPGILLASLYLLRVSSVTGELAYTYQYQQFTQIGAFCVQMTQAYVNVNTRLKSFSSAH